MPDHVKCINATKTVFRIIDLKSKIDPFSDEGLVPEKVNGDLRFENVHFSYPSRPEEKVLKGVSLEINKGETNALVGASGKRQEVKMTQQ